MRLRRGLGALAADQLAGQRQVGDGAAGLLVVNQRRHAEAGGFGEAHVTRDDGAVEGVAEMLLQLRGDIVGQADARIVHGPQQTLDLQRRVEQLADALDAVHQVGQPLQRVVLALHGDDHAVGGGQRVDGEHRQRRRAVDEDVVVVLADRRQRVAQAIFLHVHFQQHHFRGGQVAVGRQQLVAAVFGELHGLGEVALAGEHVVDGVLQVVLVDAAAGGGVALGIQVQQEDAALGRHEGGREVDTGRGLADTAFLVGDREYLSHGYPCSPHAVRRSISRCR